MVNKLQKLAPLLLLCAFLVSAQMSALSHSADHAFHEHTQQCDSFSPFDHGASLLKHHIIAFTPYLCAPANRHPAQHALTEATFHQSIRAPPAYSPA